jgi:glycosyltransferase involved in cell wall biosynthesis
MLNLSFILPCYNVERYVKDCLDSIYGISMPEEAFEVICVDDCSTDNTNGILVDYACKEKNLHIKRHSRNLTVGGARNTGVAAAQGQYIWFVDPDDCICPDTVCQLFDAVSHFSLDILFFNYEVVNESLHHLKMVSEFSNTEVQDGKQFILNYFPGNISKLGVVWQCLVRRQFLHENKIRFPEMCMGEDSVFIWNTLFSAKRVMAVDAVCYQYRKNPYSVGSNRLSPRSFFSGRIRMGSEIVRILDNQKGLPELIVNDLVKSLKWRANGNLLELREYSMKELGAYYDEIVSHADEVARVREYMNRKQRLVFKTSFGKVLWIAKVRFLCVWEGLRRKG